MLGKVFNRDDSGGQHCLVQVRREFLRTSRRFLALADTAAGGGHDQ